MRICNIYTKIKRSFWIEHFTDDPCINWKKKKKRENRNCGNGIVEIGGENLHLFQQCHCHNYQKYFFSFFLFRQWHCRNCFFCTNLGKGILVTVLPKFLFFLSPPFSLSLSYFCWILATLLPKFFLFPQFPN